MSVIVVIVVAALDSSMLKGRVVGLLMLVPCIVGVKKRPALPFPFSIIAAIRDTAAATRALLSVLGVLRTP